MNKINYFDILKHSWQITWRNKYLWWFGFLLALGGGGFNLNFPLNREEKKIDEEQFIQTFKNFVSNYWEFILAGLIILIVLTIIIIILKVIARGGLIKAVSEIIQKKTSSFRAGFSQGKKYFWKVLLLGLFIGIFMLGIIVALLSPVIFLVYLQSYIWAAVLAVPAILIIILLGILASFIREYGYIYLVLSNLSVKSSLESGFELLRKNIWPSIIFSVLLIAVGLLVGIAMLFFFFIVAAAFILTYLALYGPNLFTATGFILIAIPGAIILLFTLFLQAVFEVFKQSAWVLFFREIAAVKTEEEVTEKETVKAPGKVLDVGEA